MTEQFSGSIPLRGIRIVELSSFVAVPLAGMTLAQLGAEEPALGDDTASVLGERLGLGEREIAGLVDAGVIA